MELNAHGLLNLIFQCFENGTFQYFLPWQFSSQACEGFSRNLRSMSWTFSTIVNCSVLEAINKLKKIQILSDIYAYYHFSKQNEITNFPRTRFLNALNEKHTESFDEIIKFNKPLSSFTFQKVLFKAIDNAFNEAKRLGMDVGTVNPDKIQVQFNSTSLDDFCDEIEEEDIDKFGRVSRKTRGRNYDCDSDSDDEEDIQILTNLTEPLNFPAVANNVNEISEAIDMANVEDADESRSAIKHFFIIWNMLLSLYNYSFTALQFKYRIEYFDFTVIMNDKNDIFNKKITLSYVSWYEVGLDRLDNNKNNSAKTAELPEQK